MKLLSDPSIFRWESPPQSLYCGEMEFFHHPVRRSYRVRQLLVDPLSDLLWIKSVCEVHLLRGAHYMRRHAPFLSIEFVQQGTLLVRQRGRCTSWSRGRSF